MTTPAQVLDESVLLPEQKPELPDSCPLGKLHRKRVAQGRDLTVLVADWNLERGSGKTTLALRLAEAMDQTNAGMTPDKATLSAHELTDAYTSQPAGSALVFDEGQAGVSNRRPMAGINGAMRKIVGMGRVEQKYLIMTAPGVHQIDKDIRNMCDVWIFVRKLGEAAMFRVRYNPFRNQERTKGWGTIEWPADLPGQLQATYDDMTAEKRRRLRGKGDDGEGYVSADAVEDKIESARKDAHQQARNETLRDIYRNHDELTQQELADAIGLARGTIANIVVGES
jgi:hypothetical protein